MASVVICSSCHHRGQVLEQTLAWTLVRLVAAGQCNARLASAEWPGTAGDVGDSHQGLPHIRGSILDREVRLCFGEPWDLAPYPSGETISYLVQLRERSPAAVGSNLLPRCATPHRDDDRAVLDCVGQITDPGERSHSEGRALFGTSRRGIPSDVGPAARVPGVQDAA
jgi:hypothetical protein